ncbi:hypothetical protein LX36DRAFT_116659 [Colletotrichum falcatum]|nr:hypothetical protein LX36DRAFT_116659 [Colletotrichum falcatum]
MPERSWQRSDAPLLHRLYRPRPKSGIGVEVAGWLCEGHGAPPRAANRWTMQNESTGHRAKEERSVSERCPSGTDQGGAQTTRYAAQCAAWNNGRSNMPRFLFGRKLGRQRCSQASPTREGRNELGRRVPLDATMSDAHGRGTRFREQEALSCVSYFGRHRRRRLSTETASWA